MTWETRCLVGGHNPKTPHRTIRVDQDLWDAFGNATQDKTATLRDFMRWYTRQPGAKLPKRPEA